MLLINTLYWILPFMYHIHASEEVLMLRSTRARFRTNSKSGGWFEGEESSVSYAFSTSLQLLCLFIVCFFTAKQWGELLWFGLLAAFGLEMLWKVLRLLRVQRYQAGSVTACILLPCSVALLLYAFFQSEYGWFTLLLAAAVGVALWLLLTLSAVVYRPLLDDWLARFADRP